MSYLIRGVAAIILASVLSSACASTRTVLDPVRSTTPPGPMRNVLLVGNSVSGTIAVLEDAGPDFRYLGSINVIPDLDERMREINSRLKFWRGLIYRRILKEQLVTKFEPSDGKRFVDDVFLSENGTILYVSRSNLGDVAAFELSTKNADGTFPMIWRTVVKGRKADHAAILGSRIVVSASVLSRAQVLNAVTGKVVGEFRTGRLPHQNDYSENGERIYNGSLGRLNLPFARNHDKGRRVLTVADAKTFKVLDEHPFEFGIRPTVITADEQTAYLQLSYLNGVVKYDLKQRKIVETVKHPLGAFAKTHYPTEDDYPHNSAHHGLAMSADGSTLCDCGTIDNDVSMIATKDMSVEARIENVGMIPYWATTSADGNHCFVSLSGEDAIAVFDYRSKKQVALIPLNPERQRLTLGTTPQKFPQRSRLGKMPTDVIQRLSP